MTPSPMALEALDLARWQFGITTVYHFILVPLTIGLAPLVAIMQTLWLRTGKEHWLKATKFFGKLLLINFALGVATGIVQEFQFGMNWSEYALHVGDIFGAPLAVEALAAFFLESTFLGLWIFGWEKLPKWLHTLCIWMVALGVNLSAFWILVANSWMQHPVGSKFNPETGRAELDGLNGFVQVVTNPKVFTTFFHTVATSFLVAGTFVAGLSLWWLVRETRAKNEDSARRMWRPLAMFGFLVILISSLTVVVSGDIQGKQVVKYQPGKMAAAEGHCVGSESAGFTPIAFHDFSGDCEGISAPITIPYVYSFLATGSFTGQDSYVKGLKEVQAENEELFGTGRDYTPNLFVTYWSFRLMMGTALFTSALAFFGWLKLRKNRITDSKWMSRLALITIPMPFLGASFGWIFTEMGRQPWVVAPNPDDPLAGIAMLTEMGVSPNVTAASVLTSMALFTLLYGALGVVWYWLIKRYAREGVTELSPASLTAAPATATDDLSFGY